MEQQSVIPYVVSKLFSSDPVDYLDAVFDEIVESQGLFRQRESTGDHDASQQLHGILRLLQLDETVAP